MIGLLLAAGLAFYPVEPCRVMDTRVESIITCHPENWGICTHTISSVWGLLVAGDDTREAYKDRGFASEFPFTFADQGGKAGGCGVPRDAKAVAVNIAVSPIHVGAGHVRIWKFGIRGYLFAKSFPEYGPLIKSVEVPELVVRDAAPLGNIPVPTLPPGTSAINWPSDHCKRADAGLLACTPESTNWYNNSVTIGICDPETAPFDDCNEDVLIRPFGAAVKVIVDVYGYYAIN